MDSTAYPGVGPELYRDIAERTQGDIYMGVVGPVRTGKSTFIKRFMELMVLGGLKADTPADLSRVQRIVDELPHSGAGRTIMTTQPRFIPDEAAEIALSDDTRLRVRLVDCVGYMVRGALGTSEGEARRMVRTPWFEHDIPFDQAAELGTRKVIAEHSTLGIVVTTDGSIADIPRAAYEEPEERVINELKQLGKPFAVVLNCAQPDAPAARELSAGLSQRYDTPVIALNVLTATQDDMRALLKQVLYEFPITRVHFDTPDWLGALPDGHPLLGELTQAVRDALEGASRMRDREAIAESLAQHASLNPSRGEALLGEGELRFELPLDKAVYYRVLGELSGCEISGERQLMSMMGDMARAKREYDKLAAALDEVERTGYGLVMPTRAELRLEAPETVKQGSHYGVRIRASAPSLHIIRAQVNTEISPLVGTEKQSEEIAQFIRREMADNPEGVWDTNMFGKTLSALIGDELASRAANIPQDARDKIGELIGRVMNEGSGSMLCILL